MNCSYNAAKVLWLLACVVYTFPFSFSLFSNIGVFLTQSDHSILDNGIEDGVITSNP